MVPSGIFRPSFTRPAVQAGHLAALYEVEPFREAHVVAQVRLVDRASLTGEEQLRSAVLGIGGGRGELAR